MASAKQLGGAVPPVGALNCRVDYRANIPYTLLRGIFKTLHIGDAVAMLPCAKRVCHFSSEETCA